MAEKTEKEIEKLKGELDSLKEVLQETGPEDIFSPESQTEYSKYTGTKEQFKREAQLRQIATGRKDTKTSQTLRFITAAVFGSKDLTDIVRKRFQDKYTKEEIEEAKKTLREEFGVKKKKDDAVSIKKFRSVVNKELNPIKDSIFGIAESVTKIGEEVKDVSKKFGVLNDRFKSMTTTVTLMFGIISARGGELNSMAEKMKPMTVTDKEGQEYLYYPDAPPGRQLYEKSKTGTAGRIASKKVQRQLDSEIKRLNREENLKPVKASTGDSSVDSILDQMKILFEEESMFRKRDMEQLFGNLLDTLEKRESAKLKPAMASAFDFESDEQQAILTKALEKALQKIVNKNPDLFQSSGGGILDIRPGGSNKNTTPGPPVPSSPNGKPTTPDEKGGIFKRIKDFGPAALSLLGSYGKGATTALASTAALGIAGATAVSGAIFGAIDYGLKESGNKAIQNISKGSAQDIATAIQVPKYGAYTLQELERMASENPELKTKLEQAKVIAGLVKASKPPQLVLSPKRNNVGQEIVDQNQKRIEIQSAERVEIPSQTVNNINSTQVIPVPATKKTIEVHNQENTFNRLLAQEFDHPATYANMNMG